MPDEQTVETQDDLDASEIQDGTFVADDQETVETEETETKEKVSDDDLKKKFEALEQRLDEKTKNADDQITKLNKALHEARQENKALKKGDKKGEEETTFSLAEIQQIVEANKDDAGVLVQAVNQMLKQGIKDANKVTERTVEIAQKKQQLETVTNTWKGILDPENKAMDKVVDHFYLSDNPFAEHLAAGALLIHQWPNILKQIKEDTKKELLGEKVETARKENINKNKPKTNTETTEGDDTSDIKQSWVDAAKQFPWFKDKKKREQYYQMMRKASKKEAA